VSFVFEIILESYPENVAPALKSFLLTQLNFNPSEVSQLLSMLPTAILTTDSEEVANDYLELLNKLGVKAHLIKRVLKDVEDFEIVLEDDDVCEENPVIELQDVDSLDEVLRELEALENDNSLEKDRLNSSRFKLNSESSATNEDEIIVSEKIKIQGFTFQDGVEELTSYKINNENDFTAHFLNSSSKESSEPQTNHLQTSIEDFKLHVQDVKAINEPPYFADWQESKSEFALIDNSLELEDSGFTKISERDYRTQTTSNGYDEPEILESKNLEFQFRDLHPKAHCSQPETCLQAEGLIDPLENSLRHDDLKLISEVGNTDFLSENPDKDTGLCLYDDLTSEISSSDKHPKIPQNKRLSECSTEAALENTPSSDSNPVAVDRNEEKCRAASDEPSQKVNYHFSHLTHQRPKFFDSLERQIDFKVLGLLVVAIFLSGLNLYLFQREKVNSVLLDPSTTSFFFTNRSTPEQAREKEVFLDSVKKSSIVASTDSIKTEVFNSAKGAMTVSVKKVSETLAFIELNYKEAQAVDSLTLSNSSKDNLAWIESLRYSGLVEVNDRDLSAKGECRVLEKDPKRLARFIMPCKILITQTEAKIFLNDGKVLTLTKTD
jgi:hypothetical protein